jgi:hypothetical protein
MSASGHSRPSRASSNSDYVRYAADNNQIPHLTEVTDVPLPEAG